MNFYVANGGGTQVGRTNQFHGNLENVDVGGMGVGHLSIDKSEAMQQRVIGAIDFVVLSRARGTPMTKKPPESGAARQRSAAAPAAARSTLGRFRVRAGQHLPQFRQFDRHPASGTRCAVLR